MGLTAAKQMGALHQLLHRCTVRVDTKRSLGTGFFVAPALVVTCAHVVSDIAPGQEVSLKWQDGTLMSGRVTKKFPHPYTEGAFPDIALVEIDGYVPEHPCVLLDANEDYQARDQLYGWGYTAKSPHGESLTPDAEGEGRRGESPDAWLIKFRAAQTLSGLSGAPLLNDRTGSVCGMIKITRDEGSDLGGLAIRSSVILERFPELRDLQRTYHQDNFQWKVAGTPSYVTVPPLPDNYVERTEAIIELRRELTSDCINRSIAMIALHGMGGLGKTFLAQAICEDAKVKNMFSDGIIWLPIGKESNRNVAALMREVGSAFGEELAPDITDVSAVSWYRSAMRGRRALLVLDDVWKANGLDSFRTEAPHSRLLFTTRDASIAESYAAKVLRPGFLNKEQSGEMLARWSGLSADSLPPDADDLIHECGGLPLALATIGAMLRGKTALHWQRVNRLMRQADLGALKRQFPDYPHPNLLRALQVSVDELDPRMRERYLALAVLNEDISIHPLVQRVLWNSDANDALETAEELARLALAQPNGEDGSIRIHDLLLDYVQAQYPDRKSLALIRGALRMSSHVIARDPTQFASQLVGRLLPCTGTLIQEFTEALIRAAPRPWLRSLKPALQSPGIGLLRTLEGHGGSDVVDVAVTPDGRRAVSASKDFTLTVWDLESGRKLRTLKGLDRITAVAVTPDGRHAVSASLDRTLKVWDLESGCELRSLEGHGSGVWSVAITPDGRRAVSGSVDRTLKVWDLESGRELRTLKGHGSVVRAIALTPDGERAVSASDDHAVKVWNLESGRLLQNLEGHGGFVFDVAVTSDGRRAVSASWDCTVKVWDLESGLELRSLVGHRSGVRSVAVAPDGRRAVSASNDRTLKVWDLNSGRELRTIAGHGGVMAVVITPDGRGAVCAHRDGTLKLWDLEGSHEAPNGHGGNVLAVAVMSDGRRAVSASEDRTLKVWELESGRELRTLAGHTDGVRAVAVTPDGRCAISASSGELKVWDLESGRELRTLASHRSVEAVVVTPEGRRAVSAHRDGTLSVRSLRRGPSWTFRGCLRGHADGSVNGVAVTLDGRRAISASNDCSLKVWNLLNGRELRTLKGHCSAVSAVAVTPDGCRAVSASTDGTLKVWEIESGRELRNLVGRTREPRFHSRFGALEELGWREIRAVAITPDGRRAVSASMYGALTVWDLENGCELRTLEGHGYGVISLAVLPGGRAVSASADRTLRVWDLETSALIATFSCDASIQCCAVANDRTVVAGDAGGGVYILELEM